MDAVREKLIGMDQRYQTITNDLMDEKVFSNPALLTKLSNYFHIPKVANSLNHILIFLYRQFLLYLRSKKKWFLRLSKRNLYLKSVA